MRTCRRSAWSTIISSAVTVIATSGGSASARRDRGAPFGPARGPPDRAHLSARSAATEEPIAAVGLEARHTGARRHLEPLEDLAGPGIDSPHVALVTLPGPVPQLALDPRHAGDEAIGFDRAQNRARLRIDLVNLAAAIVSDPERALGPRQPRVAAAAGGR